MLGRIAGSLAAQAPVDEVLDELRRLFGLGGLVLRRADERLIAAAPASQAELSASLTELESATLAPANTAGAPARPDRLPLPKEAAAYLSRAASL